MTSSSNGEKRFGPASPGFLIQADTGNFLFLQPAFIETVNREMV